MTELWGPDIPPEDRIAYDYSPRPARVIPPVGNLFSTYLFYHLEDIIEDSSLYRNIMPKLCSALAEEDTIRWVSALWNLLIGSKPGSF